MKILRKNILRFFAVIILMIAGLVIYGIFVEPFKIEIREVKIQHAHFEKILKNRTIVQISDLHIEKIGQREEKVLSILDMLNPDFIFLTGDYVKWEGDYAPALTFLSRLKAKIGVWAVMGDYDYSRSRSSCLFCHEEERWELSGNVSVRFLKDAVDTVRLPAGSFLIGGVDGLDMNGESPFLSGAVYLSMKNTTPMIILSHSPLFFDMIEDKQNVLLLSGDTHGGQIPIPTWIFRVMSYKKNAKYNHGFFQKDNKRMFVSRGIGTSHFPIRLFRRPEVVVLNFVP